MANNSLIPRAISIPLILSDLSKQIVSIRRKTDTLIDYYIYPEPTPSEIAAYDPRLAILKTRVATLTKLSYTNLAYLIDDSDALTAGYLEQIIDQLINAVHGIRLIFESCYDRNLEERKPYDVIYRILEYREKQVKDLKMEQMADPQRLRAEELRPNEIGDFCRGAIQVLNGRDRGKISYVADRDLLVENRARLRQFGGAYLWWECPKCDFRLRYHLSDSGKTNILSTEEYGCEFCYAMGKKLLYGVTTFSTGRELMMHMAAKHRKVLPPGPLLQKMNVAVKDKCAEGVYRWDINFK
ncbi:hypothetical protein DV736_g2615, partial [Chaetothyriales sp. CBS 134916]